MLTIKVNPTFEERADFIRALKSDPMTAEFLRPSPEDNRIAAIFDENKLCGGMVLFGGTTLAYMLCFFYRVEYKRRYYIDQLEAAIEATWPDIIYRYPAENGSYKSNLYDIHYMKSKSSKLSQTF